MIHLNGHRLCVIDTETTGLLPRHHDIMQMCIIPLNSDLQPDKSVHPFDIRIKPQRPENIEIEALRKQGKSETASDAMLKGINHVVASDILDSWIEKLNLPLGKRIMPLATNWAFDREFIEDWLGTENFHRIFDGRYRDLMSVALFLNDVSDHHAEKVPFARSNLTNICNYLKIEFDKFAAHDALYDCLKTAEAYRQLVLKTQYFM